MVLNVEKCHFICLDKNAENETLIFKDTIMNNSKEVKILGGTIDNRLTVSSCIENYVKKLPKKLPRILNQLNDSEKAFFLTL